MDALGRALKRILAAGLGGWCIVGPLVIFALWQDAALVIVLILTALSYAFVIWNCWKRGWTFLRWLAVSILGCLAFSLGGGAVAGVFAAFTGIELYKLPWFSVVAVLLGFWAVELKSAPGAERQEIH